MTQSVSHSESTVAHRWGTTVVLLLALGIQIAFLNKPFHVDDTVVLHIARQILTNPLNPYAGELDWDGSVRTTFHVTTNPPLLSYVLAPFIAIRGEREWLMHAVMLCWQAMLWWGVVLLARRYGVNPVLATALVLLNPATIVSPNLMRDVPMVALWTLGTAWFVMGSDTGNGRLMGWGALVVGCAVLMKYSALGGVVLLAVFLATERRWRQMPFVLWALIPCALWCVHNLLVYHRLHFLATMARQDIVTPLSDRVWGTLTGLGGVWLLWLWAVVAYRHWRVLAGAVLVAFAVGWWRLRGVAPAGDIESAFWSGLGAVALVLSVARCWELRREQAFSAWWAGWVFVAIGVGAPFAAARHLLPALPPLALLWCRDVPKGQGRRALLATVLAVQCAFGIVAGWSDMQIADVYRRAARQLVREHGAQAFIGHWGWMYYAQKAGMQQVSANRLPTRPVRIAVPTVGGDASVPPALVPRLIYEKSVEVTAPARLATLPPAAGFYASLRGAPPFRWLSEGYREQFDLFTLEDDVR